MSDEPIDRIAAALERIADTLTILAVAAMPEQAPQVCEHPEGYRVYTRRMGEPVSWVCHERKGGCGFRGIGEQET